MMLTERDIWYLLEQVPDPEIPPVNLVEMGIVRKVELAQDTVTITITPTFSGCPALHAMQSDIVQQLRDAGIEDVKVAITLSPPWTTEWITDSAREKLRQFGLTPPPRHNGDFELLLVETVVCPYCGSENTVVKNNWGPTPCRAIYYCNQCRQGFEQFKPL
jgi:ring-1,2-phenylacetyl-CoA epoxidase subunit PaaD